MTSPSVITTKLKVGSAGGPDNLKPIFMKSLANELAGPLSHIFEILFHSGCVPSSWKLAHITPVFKKGDPSLASYYRPVSLTSVCCKLMETVIKDQMMYYLLKMKFISRHHHGFLMRHSTCIQLLECVQDWSVTLKNKQSMDTLYVDFSRAFDSVVHSKLMNKLLQLGIRDALFGWIGSFLTNRSQCVVVENSCSKLYKVISGVPKGSVLGPVLFLLFINDMTEIFDDTVTCKLFADDVKIYSMIDGTIASPLTKAIDSLSAWSKKWQMQINISKCKVLHLGKNNPCINYVTNGHIIQPVMRDLGVEVDNLLTFGNHIDNIISRAYQRIAILFKGFVSRGPQLLKRAYIVYVRPISEYCSSVWSPHKIRDIEALERVHR